MRVRPWCRPVRALALGILALGVTASPLGALGIVPPANPAANVAPAPNFLSSGSCARTASGAYRCANPCLADAPVVAFPGYRNTAACAGFVLRSIDHARDLEGLAPMVLPRNWLSLNPQKQLFVLVDLARVARGLPPYLGLNRALSGEAERAARHWRDPQVARGFAVAHDAAGVPAMGSTWAAATTTLEALYVWLYDDGWAGSASATANTACTSADALGCWTHRDQLLGRDAPFNPGVGLRCTSCEVGAGFASAPSASSFTVLLERPKGSPPPMYFTWARDVVPYLAPALAGSTAQADRGSPGP